MSKTGYVSMRDDEKLGLVRLELVTSAKRYAHENGRLCPSMNDLYNASVEKIAELKAEIERLRK